MQVKCTSCGATQNINEAKNCDFCGNLIELESAKSNYQKAMQSENGNLMAMAETAIEATNWEEALQFFNQVLVRDITNSDAWLGKGIAIVYTSKIGDLKINEAIAYWKNAIKHAEHTEAMGKRVAKEINEVVNKFYPSLENHFIQFKDLDNSYQELVGKFVILEKAQDYATQLDIDNLMYYETGFALCKRVIQIPKQYAISDEGAAWAQGIIGAVQDNKYKRQDAVKARQKASDRQKEIEIANVIVFQLEEKYIREILRIEPNNISARDQMEQIGKYSLTKQAGSSNAGIKLKLEFFISCILMLILVFIIGNISDSALITFLIPIALWVSYYYFSFNKRTKEKLGISFDLLYKDMMDNKK